MARPKAVIDAADVEKLASFGLTQIEIADVLGCNHSTISRRFAKEWTKGHAALKRSLRRKQTEVALSGNVVMLIWLGKNMLGQVDRQELDNSGEIKHIVRVEYIDTPIAALTSGTVIDQE